MAGIRAEGKAGKVIWETQSLKTLVNVLFDPFTFIFVFSNLLQAIVDQLRVGEAVNTIIGADKSAVAGPLTARLLFPLKWNVPVADSDWSEASLPWNNK